MLAKIKRNIQKYNERVNSFLRIFYGNFSYLSQQKQLLNYELCITTVPFVYKNVL